MNDKTDRLRKRVEARRRLASKFTSNVEVQLDLEAAESAYFNHVTKVAGIIMSAWNGE